MVRAVCTAKRRGWRCRIRESESKGGWVIEIVRMLKYEWIPLHSSFQSISCTQRSPVQHGSLFTSCEVYKKDSSHTHHSLSTQVQYYSSWQGHDTLLPALWRSKIILKRSLYVSMYHTRRLAKRSGNMLLGRVGINPLLCAVRLGTIFRRMLQISRPGLSMDFKKWIEFGRESSIQVRSTLPYQWRDSCRDGSNGYFHNSLVV